MPRWKKQPNKFKCCLSKLSNLNRKKKIYSKCQTKGQVLTENKFLTCKRKLNRKMQSQINKNNKLISNKKKSRHKNRKLTNYRINQLLYSPIATLKLDHFNNRYQTCNINYSSKKKFLTSLNQQLNTRLYLMLCILMIK